MKNILVIQGGGRPRGNTAQLIESFAGGAKEGGNTVEVISLIKNEVRDVWAAMPAVTESRVSKRTPLTI